MPSLALRLKLKDTCEQFYSETLPLISNIDYKLINSLHPQNGFVGSENWFNSVFKWKEDAKFSTDLDYDSFINIYRSFSNIMLFSIVSIIEHASDRALDKSMNIKIKVDPSNINTTWQYYSKKMKLRTNTQQSYSVAHTVDVKIVCKILLDRVGEISMMFSLLIPVKLLQNVTLEKVLAKNSEFTNINKQPLLQQISEQASLFAEKLAKLS